VALTLQKQILNFVLDQGCTFSKVVTAKDTAGANVTISTGTAAGKMRQSYHSSNNVHAFTTAIEGSNVTFSLTSTQTTAIPDGNYVFDVEYTQAGGDIERIVEGLITVSPEATK
tara:strand:- start:136 stop:477 length:342 start_codon:yes stop_codon:yes gene_type:complete